MTFEDVDLPWESRVVLRSGVLYCGLVEHSLGEVVGAFYWRGGEERGPVALASSDGPLIMTPVHVWYGFSIHGLSSCRESLDVTARDGLSDELRKIEGALERMGAKRIVRAWKKREVLERGDTPESLLSFASCVVTMVGVR